MDVTTITATAATPADAQRAAGLARAAGGHLDAALAQLRPPGHPLDPGFVVDVRATHAALLDALDTIHAALELDLHALQGNVDLHLARDEVHDAWALLAVARWDGPGAAARIVTHVEMALHRVGAAADALGAAAGGAAPPAR